ncbi:MAG: caspase family protein [Vulcanimicrobiota bacterium]
MKKLLLLALMLSSLGWADGPDIRAVMVGVGAYQNTGAWEPLEGPPGDVEKIKKALVDRFKADPAKLTIVTQEQATRAGLEGAMKKLVTEAQPGETVIFFYAGHGCAVPNREPPNADSWEKNDPEDDGLDECIIPIDAPGPNDPTFADSVVRDDFIETALQQLIAKVRSGGQQGSVVFIFDSCHSGTISRSASTLGKKIRTGGSCRQQARSDATLTASRHAAGGQGWVVLSACQAHQTAKEDPTHGGDFTHALVSGLEDPRLGPDSSYLDLLRLVGANTFFYDQTPMGEGDLKLSLLGGKAIPRQETLSVVSATPTSVILDRGRLLGVTPGSRVALYRVGTRSPDDQSKKLCEAVVGETGTDLYRANAALQGSASLEDLRSAVGFVMEQNFGEVAVEVFVDPQAEALGLLNDPVVKKVERGAGAEVLAWNDNGNLRLERATGEVILSPTREPALIHRALKGEARRLYLQRMVNQPQSLEVEMVPGKFSGSIESFQPDPSHTAGPNGLFAFAKGQEALLKITNKSQSPLYVSVLNFLADGGVKVLYPYGIEAQKKVSPGQTLTVDLAFDGGSGREGFKVIGTSQEVDLLFLESQGKQRSSSDPSATVAGPFGKLMENVMQGTRAGRPTIKEPQAYVAREVLWVDLK